MNKLLTQRRPLIAVGTIACLLVLVAGWFLLISPTRAKVAEVRGQVSAQDSSNSSLRAQLSSLQALAAQLPAQRAKLAEMSGKVPDKPALPELLRVLTDAAAQSSVTLTGISPAAPAPIAGADGVSGIDVTLKVEGDYVAIEQYELALEGLSRAFLVQGVVLGENGSAGGTATPASTSTTPATAGSGGTKLTATITGRVLIGSPAAAAATS
jgi:Tfp pilus assembly protein PilO